MTSPRSPQYQDQNKVNMVTNFIDNQAPSFHPFFGLPSSFNPTTMSYEAPEIKDLREILEYHQQKARKYVDFTTDLTNCTWDQVHAELKKAQAAVLESERRGKNPIRRAIRAIGNTSSILAPGLSALPDNLCILNGALALIFSLARHSELNRVKILGAFENVPNIIEMAQNKAQTFPLDGNNPKSVRLHSAVRQLQETLLKSLPPLINKLIPSGFVASLQRPFGSWNIDRILEEVKTNADAVRTCAEGLLEEVIVGNYAASMTMQSQLNEILQHQRMIYMSLNAPSQGKNQLFTMLMDQFNLGGAGFGMGYYLPPNALGRGSVDQTDLVSERGTALPGYTPEDLLKIMDVSHLRITTDEIHVLRKYASLPAAEVDRASRGIMSAPAIKDLLNVIPASSADDPGLGPGVVSIDGHFDRTQITQVTALSYICAVLSQALRQQAEQQAHLHSLNAQYTSSPGPTSPLSPSPDSPTKPPPIPNPTIILTYFCALHTSPDDPLSGPQGLLRCLTTQLLLSLLSNELVNPSSPLDLLHLSSSQPTSPEGVLSEEDLLHSLEISALSRLFSSLICSLPPTIPIFIIIDSLSSYERDEINIASEGTLREQYNSILEALITAMDVSNLETGGNCVRILITSPTRSRWLFSDTDEFDDAVLVEHEKEGREMLGLEGYLLPGGRISLRGMGLGHGNGSGLGSGGMGKTGARVRGIGVSRASTLPVFGHGHVHVGSHSDGVGGIDTSGMMDGGANFDRGYQVHDVGPYQRQDHVENHGQGQGFSGAHAHGQYPQGAHGHQGWQEGHDRRSSA